MVHNLMRRGVSRIVIEVIIIGLVIASSTVLVSLVPRYTPCDVSVEIASVTRLESGVYDIGGTRYNIVKAYKLTLLLRNACPRPLTDINVKYSVIDSNSNVCANPTCDVLDPSILPNAVPDTVPPNSETKLVLLVLTTKADVGTILIALSGDSGGNEVSAIAEFAP